MRRRETEALRYHGEILAESHVAELADKPLFADTGLRTDIDDTWAAG